MPEKFDWMEIETIAAKNSFVAQNPDIPMRFVNWYKYSFTYVSANGLVLLTTPQSNDLYRTELKAEMSLKELWKKESTIKRELAKICEALKNSGQHPPQRYSELYSAQQALSWVLDKPNTMSPYKSAMLTED